jgi:hypothetical protein
MLRIETALGIVAILLAVVCPSLGAHWFERIERVFSRQANRRALSVASVGVAALILRAALLPIEPIPEPVVHDEFGYLLAADTFAHGRLTNPTHPMWVHFESFNILQKPTYQCITPPIQGIILAFGKVVLGHPFWGVWLSAGLMCAAFTWMLQGWVPPEWALLGGVLAILRYGVWTYWADSYWGGAAGAIGGALALGALPRIKRSERALDALLLALGLSILINNRPYEGLILTLPVFVALLSWMFGSGHPQFKLSIRQVILPITAVIVLTAIGTGYYFFKVTGSPFRMPYQVERETYAVAPYLLWQHERPEPIYHNAVIRKMYVDEELVGYRIFRTPIGMVLKAFIAWKFYLGPLLTLPLLSAMFALPYGFSWKEISSCTRFLLITLAIVIIGCLLESFYAPHYSSPAAALVLVLVVISLRCLRQWRRTQGPSGVFLTRAFVAVAAVMFIVRMLAAPLHIPLNSAISPAWFERGPSSFGRAAVQNLLTQLPGNHLVLVHYGANHEPFVEWVYNDADIDHSKVVWAREMDAAENERLLNYFKDRKLWLLDADVSPPRLEPYFNRNQQIQATWNSDESNDKVN